MRSPSLRRRSARARLAAASLVVAGVLCLLLPAVAAASTGHDGGGSGLPLALPVASIFSDVLGSVSSFGKDIVKAIFGSILSLFFGGSWQVLLHPYEIIEWLIGLPGTGNTTAFVPFGNDGAGPFAALVRDTQAIGLGLLPLALANNTLHLVGGGIFTRPRDHMNDFGKVFLAACAIVAWPWLFGQVIVLANTITLAMLHAAGANGNLWKALGAYFVTAWAGGFLDLITTGFLIATALLLVGLIVMKIVLMVALAFLLVVGPIAIAFYPFEFLSRILMLFASVFLALALIPLGWAVLFALFAAFGASVFGFSNFIHAGLIGGTMKDTFDLICSLICFYLAWKWPFIILSRITSLVGGNVAAAGQAFSQFGHGGAAARNNAGTPGSTGASAAGDTDGSSVAGKLKGVGDFAQRFGSAGGAVFGGVGSGAAGYAGYGALPKGARALHGAVAARRGTATTASTGQDAPNTPDVTSSLTAAEQAAANPIGAAVSGGTDAGFDAVRANARDFTSSPAGSPADADKTAALINGGASIPGAVGQPGAPQTSSATDSAQQLAREVAMTAALTSAHAPAGVAAPQTPDANHSSAAALSAAVDGHTPAPSAATPTPENGPPVTTHASHTNGAGDPRDALRQPAGSTPAPPTVPTRSGTEPAAAPPSPARAGMLTPTAASPASTRSAAAAPATPAPRAASSPAKTAERGSRPAPAASVPSGTPTQRPVKRATQPNPPQPSHPSADSPRHAAPDARSGDRPDPAQQPPMPVSPPENH